MQTQLERPKLFWPLVLFIITIITTTTSGAFFEGANPFSDPFDLIHGLPFSASLILILGTHELGHFLASRSHGVPTTLPTFIPGPPIPPMIGTFGAVIKIKSAISTKNALTDIGAAGPLAGFVLALIVSWWGLKLSWMIPMPVSGQSIGLGSSITFHLMSNMILGPIPEGYELFVHPVAFAGWIGLFITSINLLPVGQLDGGHILYAVAGRYHRQVSIIFVCILAALGIFSWPGWLIWTILISVIGLRHPPTLDHDAPLDPKRKAVSVACLVVFILTFTPTPFYII